jgi:histidinol-phosphate aminotransferase
MRAVLPDLHLYPETGDELRHAIAQSHGVPDAAVLLGHGATDILDVIARTFVCPGDEVISAHPGFPWYQMLGQLNGAVNVVVPLRDHTHDLAAMAERITERTKLIFVANPNNPTGTMVSAAQLDGFVARLPGHVVLVVDEAYIEYADHAPDTMGYLADRHVIAVRTFSKIAGLAGLRIGYAVAQPGLIELLDKVRPPFSTTSLAHAAALASLSDDHHRRMSRDTARAGAAHLAVELSRLGLGVVPSQANFVFVDFASAVAPIAEALLRRGFVIRPVLGSHARVTVGTAAQTEGLIRALREVLRDPDRAAGVAHPAPSSVRIVPSP